MAAPTADALHVIKRGGAPEEVRFEAVTERNADLCSAAYGRPLDHIRPRLPGLTQEVALRFRNGMSTHELDLLTVSVCAAHSTRHRDYSDLAARITVSDLHKTTPSSFVAAVRALRALAGGRLSEELVGIAERAAAPIDARLVPARDYAFTYFGIQTMIRSYLQRQGGAASATVERPQHAYMRVALGICVAQPDRRGHEAEEEVFRARLARAFEVYELLSTHRLTHASPTVFNAGTRHPQLSSCFLLRVDDDLDTLFQVVHHSAMISKWAGGVGIGLTPMRAEGALIRSTGGTSSGLSRYVAMLNASQLYVNQGGLRPGAYALYLEPWHADVFTFLEMGRFTGSAVNAPDLKYALWVPDLFMEAVCAELADPSAGDWHLFSPDLAPGLDEVYGDKFRALYRRYVDEGLYTRVVKASQVVSEWFKTVAQKGNPYVLFKDHINRKSNLSHVRTISHSNLCVAGETHVLTKAGQIPITALVGQEIDVWNGSEWSTVAVEQTAEDAELLRVILDNGASLRCTPWHKFYDAKGLEIRAGALVPGTVLEKATAWPIIEDGEEFPHAYTHGLFCADGHYGEELRRCGYVAHHDGHVCRKHANHSPVHPIVDGDTTCRANVGSMYIHLYQGKQALCENPNFEAHPDSPGLYFNEEYQRLTVRLPDTLPAKYEVPLKANLASRLRWLEGYCDGDGCVARNGTTYSIQVCSTNLEFLDKVRLMLQTLGCDPKCANGAPARTATIQGVEYECKETRRILITSTDLWRLRDLGFCPSRLDFAGAVRPNRDARRFVKVVSTEPAGRGPTYCFTEPLRHRGVFGGILTGQCAEITIPSWHDAGAPEKAEYGVCNLAALPLASFLLEGEDGEATGIDWGGLRAAARAALQNLDSIIDLNFYPVEACRRSNCRHRPVAIGVAGLADVFARLGLIYGSEAACALDAAIHAVIYHAAMSESAALAAAKGPFDSFPGSPTEQGVLQPDMWVSCGHLESTWEGRVSDTTRGFLTPEAWAQLRDECRKGVRNGYVTADMPTATSSQTTGQNEAFEPFTTNLYTRKTLAGDFAILNPHLVRELEKLDLWDEEMRLALLESGGSVLAEKRVPSELRRRFRTAREIDQRLLTRHAAARNPFLSQTMSLNYYFGVPVLSDALSVLVDGWKAGLTTGSYYIHTSPAAGAQKQTFLRQVAPRSGPETPAVPTKKKYHCAGCEA